MEKFEIKEIGTTEIKAKVCVAGESGSGKTYGSLLIAKGLTGDLKKVGVINTAGDRVEYYRKEFPGIKVIHLTPPYSPERFIGAIETLEEAGMEAVVIDSVTDEWASPGGVWYEINKKKEQGGNLAKLFYSASPRHKNFLSKISNSKVHIVATVDKIEKLDIKTGKTYITDHQRKKFDAPYTIKFDLDKAHNVQVVRDDSKLFAGKSFKITDRVGAALKDWCLI